MGKNDKLKIFEIEWFDDDLPNVACHSACELDAIRLGREWPTKDRNCCILATWLMDVARERAPFHLSAEMLIGRATEQWQPERPKMAKIDEIRAFSREMSIELLQAVSSDPTLSGMSRQAVMYFCLELSKYAMVDRTFHRDGAHGRWRNATVPATA